MTSRPLEHCTFHDGFGNHSLWKLRSWEQIELATKLLALFYRGIVIADADLNNNSVFYSPPARELLYNAVASGFIKRAPRVYKAPGQSAATPIRQQQLYEAFARNNKKLAAEVLEGHPAALDAILERAETEPLTWNLGQLANIFGQRLLFGLQDTHMPAQERTYCEVVLQHVRATGKQFVNLRAATIKDELFDRWPDSQAKRNVWAKVENAYSGNLPLAFEGALQCILHPASHGLIAGGPQATGFEKQAMGDYYRSIQASRTSDRFNIVEEPLAGRSRFAIDLKALRELSLEDIENLRERAEPDGFFNMRYATLGCPSALAENAQSLIDARDSYVEKLVSAGVALTSEKKDQAISTAAHRYLDIRLQAGRERIPLDSAKIIIQLFIPMIGSLVCLFDAVMQVADEFARLEAEHGCGTMAKMTREELDYVLKPVLIRPNLDIIRESSELKHIGV